MADDNDDSWLYGANHDDLDATEQQSQIVEETEPNAINADEEQTNFDHQQQYDEHNFEEAGDDEHVATDESLNIEKER